jgi:hypothetical protein
MLSTDEQLYPLFIPSLAATLKAKEDEKGCPLTEQEVLAIRDGATVMMVNVKEYFEMEDTRGYRDIDPKNCWAEWRELRQKFT